MLLLLHSAICWLLRVRVILVPESLGCSGHGDLDACGQCICEKNYFGNACECYYYETLKSGPQNTSAAIAECTPNVEDALVCSGQGKCHCGHCRCFPTKSNPDDIYSGVYCECDDYSCSYHNDKICGGHGQCKCGKCMCDSGYEGEACECPISQDPCRSDDGLLCNGVGTCNCGMCECDVHSHYHGPTCEECPTCPGQCMKYRDCIKCKAFNRGPYSAEKCDQKCPMVQIVYRINKEEVYQERGENECVMARSCEDCFLMSSCGWYKHHELPTNIKVHCDLLNNFVLNGISEHDILTYENVDVRILEPASRKCNGDGSLDTCGQCQCQPNYYGKSCECDASDGITSEAARSRCVNPLSTSTIPCSGRGECICGMCSCFARRMHSAKKYSGMFCECDDYSCSFHNDELCGGHGQCVCGRCMCDSGYAGEACECPLSQNPCFTDDGLLCNGVGTCNWGMCECDVHSHYHGPTCEECPTCQGQCMKYRECIKCKAFKRGPYSKEECDQKCPLVQIVYRIIKEEVNQNPKQNLCSFTEDDIDGLIVFAYEYVELNAIRLIAQTITEEDRRENQCVMAGSCEDCFLMSSCGWYKHHELPTNIKVHCDLLNNFALNGISENDILTFENADVRILEPASMKCTGRGSLDTCGQCQCQHNFYGKSCECDASDGMTSEAARSQCVNPYLTDDNPCSGRGDCICGMCSCYQQLPGSAQRYSGQYCECNDFSCPYHNGMMCGGLGKCVCGQCQCYSDFEGDACECPTSFDMCKSPDGRICNGQGKCICGKCVCDGTYRGRTCEECPTCPGPCVQYKDCVLCRVFQSGPYSPEECEIRCPKGTIILVDAVNMDGENRDEKLCSFIDYSDNTRVYFTYTYDKSYNIEIKAQTVKLYEKP